MRHFAEGDPAESQRRHLWWHGCAVRMGFGLTLLLAVFSWILLA